MQVLKFIVPAGVIALAAWFGAERMGTLPEGIAAQRSVALALLLAGPVAALAAIVARMASPRLIGLVLLSAGFDAHCGDPIGGLGLEVEDFIRMTTDVLDVARVHADGRLVSVLEGGYDVLNLARCVVAHVTALGAEPLFQFPH